MPAAAKQERVRVSVTRHWLRQGCGWRVTITIVSTGEVYDGVKIHATKEAAMKDARMFADTIEGQAQ